MRIIARIKALGAAAPSRNDVEGLEEADVEVYSNKTWTKWRLGLSDADSTALSIWRGGAVRTPTRVFYRNLALDDVFTHCRQCGGERGSAKHMFKECPKLEEHRQYLARTHHMSSDWWRQQPRCTAKSGWIVKGAAGTAEARAHCAVAACKLGVAIVNAGNFEGKITARQEVLV